jgi:hypothetical protein
MPTTRSKSRAAHQNRKQLCDTSKVSINVPKFTSFLSIIPPMGDQDQEEEEEE